MAVLATAATVALRWLLDPWLGGNLPFITLFGVVALAVWYGGTGAGIAATLLGLIACDLLFIEPRGSLALSRTHDYIGFGLYLFTCSLLIGLGHALRLAQRRTKQSGELLKVTFGSIGDAVITTDVNGSVTYLNPVAASITAWRAQDAIGQPLDAVFRIVDAQTRKPVESPVPKALSEGRIVGLASQAVLIAKDGTERPIDDSASPITDARGQLLGCVLIFRDVTLRRNAETALRASRAELELEAQALATLNEASSRLWRVTDLAEGLDLMLTASIELLRADMGNLQILDERRQVLVIAAQHGFGKDFLEFFREVSPVDDSACGQALRAQQRVVIEDVESSVQFAPLREVARKAGFRSVQSTPLLNHEGLTVGILSTHWRSVHRPSEQELRRHDLLARQAGDFIARFRTEQALRRAYEAQRSSEERATELLKSIRVSEEKLRVQFEELKALYAAAPIGLCLFDRDYRYVRINKALADMNGIPAAAHIGKTPHEVVPDVAAEAERVFRQVLDTEQTVQLELRGNTQGAHERVWDEQWYPVRNERGVVEGVGVIVTDITLRTRAEEAIREADRRKDEFLATLAHELRNPLAPLRNALQLQKLADGKREILDRARGVMERQVQQLVRLVDDLLDVSRITGGKLRLQKKRTALKEVLDVAVETSRPVIEGAGHVFTVEVPEQPIYLDADVTRLAQVFANLLNNAAKFTPRGGHIWLTAEGRDAHAAIVVRDTGMGMRAEDMPHLFKLFAQARPTAQDSGSGLGIGLALAKGLVEMHGGTIDALSAGLGKGSEFVVKIPRLAAAHAERSAESRVQPAATRRRIVVVDDLKDAADSFATMLQMMGHDTCTAYDGLEAVQTVAAFNPDIVFLDIGLPKMNGYEAARDIRSSTSNGRRVKLIAVTGWGQERDRRLAEEAGFDDHLTKPADPETIQRLIEDIDGESAAGPP